MANYKHPDFVQNATVEPSFAGHSFEQLFKQYFARLCYFSFQLVGDKETAEDIVQETFIKYWNQRDEVATHNVVIKNFLYTAVRRASLNVIRHDKVVQLYLQQQDPSPIDDACIVHTIIQSEVYAEIYRAIESLPKSCQRISRMSYLEGLKNSEIAEQLGLSVNTIKTQKQRALQLLRLKFKPEVFAFFLLMFNR